MKNPAAVNKLSFLALLLIFLLPIPIHAKPKYFHVTQDCVYEDIEGNTYVAGRFMGRITFGEITLRHLLPESRDFYLVKYDPAGRVIWARSTGVSTVRSSSDGIFINSNAIAVDKNGNIYLAGVFTKEAIFDSTRLSSQSKSAFMAKFSPQGRVIWANKLGPLPDKKGKPKLIISAIAADNAGNTYVTGSFFGRIASGTDTVTSSNSPKNPDTHDVLVAKISADGKMVWAKRAGDIHQDEGQSIALDGSGNLFVTGWVSRDKADIDSISAKNVWNGDLFVARYDTSGNELWLQNSDLKSHNKGKEIAADENGNCYVLGNFMRYYALKKWSIGVLITKYNLAGETVWTKKFINPNYKSSGRSISLNASGHCTVAGEFLDTLILDSARLVSKKGHGKFLAEFDMSGKQISLRNIRKRRFDKIQTIKACPSGNVLVGGINNGRQPILFFLFSDYTGNYIAKYNRDGKQLWRRKIRRGE